MESEHENQRRQATADTADALLSTTRHGSQLSTVDDGPSNRVVRGPNAPHQLRDQPGSNTTRNITGSTTGSTIVPGRGGQRGPNAPGVITTTPVNPRGRTRAERVRNFWDHILHPGKYARLKQQQISNRVRGCGSIHFPKGRSAP